MKIKSGTLLIGAGIAAFLLLRKSSTTTATTQTTTPWYGYLFNTLGQVGTAYVSSQKGTSYSSLTSGSPT